MPGFSTGWARILNHRPIRRVGSNTTVTISISPRGPPPGASMHPGLEHGVICRGGPSKGRGIPSPHIAWPGGLVNLVLFTVAKENSENVRLKATARAGVIMGQSTLVCTITPWGGPKKPGTFPPEQKRKETVEYFPPLGSSVWIFL